MKKNGMKKWSALVLALLMLLSQIVAVSAEETNSDDAEYELAVAAIMRDYWNDPEGTVSRLAELDTELVGEPTVEAHQMETGNMARETLPTDYTLSVYSFKRGNSSNYYLQWSLDCNKREWRHGPLDYVSLEWDTACADYYISSGDGEFSSVSSRSTGIVLFTLEDEALRVGDCAIGTMQVTPTVAGEMEYGCKFAHTYNKTTITGGTVTPQFDLTRAGGEKTFGVGYTSTFSLTFTTDTATWDMWRDNAVTMHL